MIKTGLVSLSFNDHSIIDVVRLVANNCLQSIEWSGDRHVPVGEVELAKRVRQITESHALEVAAYGSHYRAGFGEGNGYPFDAVLQTAVALGAPTIRVWAGNQSPDRASFNLCNDVNADLNRIATLAQRYGIAIAVEMQLITLAETAEAAKRIMDSVRHRNLSIIWKMRTDVLPEVNTDDLIKLLPLISDFRVSYNRRGDRRPLHEGESAWKGWLHKLKRDKGDRYALLENIAHDDVEQLAQDSQKLRDWVYVANKF